jgi:signal transduction histidine kinase
MLRALWPPSPVHVCSWRQGPQRWTVVLDETAHPRLDLATTGMVGLLDWEQAEQPYHRLLPVPSAWSLPQHDLLLHRTRQMAPEIDLALALPRTSPPEHFAMAQALLTSCCEQLGAALTLLQEQQRCQQLQAELHWYEQQHQLGELAGPLAHEINNFLNNTLLYAALLEMEIPESLRPDLSDLQRRCRNMAALVKHWQQYRQRRHADEQPLTLNELIRMVMSQLGTPAAQNPNLFELGWTALGLQGVVPPAERPVVVAHLELAAHVPTTSGVLPDGKLLLRLLIRNAVRALVGKAGMIHLRTQHQGEKVCLEVEDSGPDMDPELLPYLFDPGEQVRPGTDRLELAVCKSIVRRWWGSIAAHNRPGGGVCVTVELPVQGER